MNPRGNRVRVDAMTAATRGYEVHVRAGILNELAARVAAAAPAASYAIIAPHNLATTHAAAAHEAFRARDLPVELLLFDDAEVNKTRETWAALTDRMMELRLGRDTCVIALGGGVTGDLAGFVAATYMRGVSFVQVPTSLLAMIDASVGGKTGVDVPAGKNLVGAFHAPRLVVIDPLVLRTLPPVEFRAGMAEAIKHGAILDALYFAWIEENTGALLTLEESLLERLILRSVELKAEVVSEDPLEDARRAILNFGHTVGHAIESRSGFSVPHGFAVASGMVVEARIGESLGITERGTAERVAQLCRAFDLPTSTSARLDDLLPAMRMDKKSRRSQPRFVLLRRVGECARDAQGAWTHPAAGDHVEQALGDVAPPPAGV